MKSHSLIAGLLLLTAALCHGKAYFFTRTELVQKSTAIAIVELAEPEGAALANGEKDPFSNTVPGEHWAYSQQAKVKVVEIIKGDLPREIVMHGGESFICAQCHLSKGRFLAFLKRDKDLWVGSNWHLSLRPVKDGKIEWYIAEEQRAPMSDQPQAEVIAQVRALAAAEPKPPVKGE